MPQETLPTRTARGPFHVVTAQDGEIRECALRAAQLAQPGFAVREQRSLQRVPYPRLITLTPLSDDQLCPTGDPIQVVGKHLAPLGLDFFHHEPILQRYAIASLETGPNHWTHFLLKITWCRYLKSNWYDSGGRFVKMVEWSDPSFIGQLRSPSAQLGAQHFSCPPQQK